MPAEKAGCIFCRIASGEIPCHKVYEDAESLGFLDIRPHNPGHVLLIPKRHYRWVDDVPPQEYFTAAQRVSRALKKALGAFSVTYLTLGFEVEHAHLHLIPRFEGDGHGGFIDWKNVKSLPDAEMKRIAGLVLKAARD